MVNFFRRIQPQSPMLRNNYFIQVDDKLAWSESIGSEDATAEGEVGWFTAEKNKAIEHHYFRSERQSLRRYVAIVISYFILVFILSLSSILQIGSRFEGITSNFEQTTKIRWCRVYHTNLYASNHKPCGGTICPRPTG